MDGESNAAKLVRGKKERADADVAPMVDWSSVPKLLHPMHGGRLPEKRAGKKCAQLESMAAEVVRIVRGD